MRIARVLGSTLVAIYSLTAGSVADEIREAVVRIEVTRRTPDLMRPWSKQNPQEQSGSGVVLDGGQILTNAHVVLYASRILIQPYQQAEKLPARVVAISPGIDLALLELESDKFEEGQPTLKLAEEVPKVREAVQVYGYPLGGDELSVTEGIVSRIEFTTYYYDTPGLRIQVDAALNQGNSGGPAITDDKVVGLVFSTIKEAENIGYLIPVDEIAAFLTDAEDGICEGRPMLFDIFQGTENSALREWLGLSDEMQGIMVKRPYRTEESYPLKAGDVLTHIGPHAIDRQGKVRVLDDSKLSFLYYVPLLSQDDHVECTVFREGESHLMRVPTDRERDRLVPMLRGKYPQYFIYGPLVFSEASFELYQAGRGRLLGALATRGSPLVGRMSDPPSFPEERLVIIANRMFAHRITKGYGGATFGVVQDVNDQPVTNLRQMIGLLREASGEFVVFRLAGQETTYAFRRDEIEEASEEILTDEGIRYQASEGLRDAWEVER